MAKLKIGDSVIERLDVGSRWEEWQRTGNAGRWASASPDGWGRDGLRRRGSRNKELRS